MLERIIAELRAQSLRIGMGPEVHDLRDQPMLVPKSVFRGLPPNLFAGERKQVHEVILHGRRPAIHRRPSGRIQRDTHCSCSAYPDSGEGALSSALFGRVSSEATRMSTSAPPRRSRNRVWAELIHCWLAQPRDHAHGREKRADDEKIFSANGSHLCRSSSPSEKLNDRYTTTAMHV